MEASVSKGEFAAIIGVSPGRVSQYLAEGKITPAALVGQGRSAKILVERAKADLRLTLDIGQRLGNGLETRLDATGADGEAAPPSQTNGASAPPVIPAGVDYEIKQQKLEQIRRANRNGAIADAQARGQLTETDAAKAEMTRVAAGMLQVFEGGLSDFAAAVAGEFKVPQRDVLHLLRRQFRLVRANAAKQMAAQMLELPETVETELTADDVETIN